MHKILTEWRKYLAEEERLNEIEMPAWASKIVYAPARALSAIERSVRKSTGIRGVLDPSVIYDTEGNIIIPPTNKLKQWQKDYPAWYAAAQAASNMTAGDPIGMVATVATGGAAKGAMAGVRAGRAGIKAAKAAKALKQVKPAKLTRAQQVGKAAPKKVGKAAPKGAARRAAELTRAQKADALHAAEMRVGKAAHNVEMAKLAKTRARTEKGIEHWNMKDWATAREAHVEFIQTAKEFAFDAKKLMKANPGNAAAKTRFDNALKRVRSAQGRHDKHFKGKTLEQARDAYLTRSGPKALAKQTARQDTAFAKQTARQDAELARLSKYRGMPTEEIILDQAKHMRTPDFTIKGVRVADMPKSQKAGHFKMLDKIEQTVAKSKAFKAARPSREAARDAKFAKMDAETAALRTKLAKDTKALAKDTKAWNVKANAELDAQKAEVFKKFAAALKADPGNKVLQQYVKGMRGVLNAMPRHGMGM